MQFFKYPKAPTVTKYTSGSGTYVPPSGVLYLEIEMVGGGGASTAGQTAAGGSMGTAANGTDSTFGTSLLTAVKGSGASTITGGNGGTTTVNSPAISIRNATGQKGAASSYNNTGATVPKFLGSPGGSTPLGPGGAMNSANGVTPIANTGAGASGGSAGTITNTYTGAGGGGAGYINAIIPNPDPAGYAYSVGTGGTYTAGAGNAGAAGADGIIIIKEFY